ncbi:MAG: hypothetical protein KatS3mg015_2422 [Fimbriimonadales bacterium]|nr:MAG: hypothetical protein KatS3mg015_2422 [Fimbriimonadales bacterium]
MDGVWDVPPYAYPDWLQERWQQAERNGGLSDRLVLLRQHLRYIDTRTGGRPSLGKVPAGEVTEEALRRHGLDVVARNDQSLSVIARPWQPAWLPDAETIPPAQEAFRIAPRRPEPPPVPGDPFLSRLQLPAYKTAGQRTAIRSTLTAPDGAALQIILSTGSGKSLCAHLPAAMDRSGLTLVVVPTVGLALDQEKALQHWVDHPEDVWGPHPYAYQGGSSEAVRLTNEMIRERIRTGEQRILFTSPEAVLTSLAPALTDAARSGLLRRLVIDESHIVSQWGEEFRPSFQDLAGFRRALLEQAPQPFTTILLSATISKSTLETLKAFFEGPGPFETMAATALRPEPSYWMHCCQDGEEQKIRVLEAINHLPRPLILYVLTREDTKHWSALLREAGYRRLAAFSGETSTGDRNRIVEQWRCRELDMVVATSAFGMGVDLPEVRSVVHACYPESLDRYYQEVGRSGRDGYASLALMLYTKKDYEIAQSMASRTYIGVEKGLSRWERMFHTSERLGEGLHAVSLEVAPEAGMSSRKNEYWNLRTLTLMHRAGLIELRGLYRPEAPTEGLEDDESEDEEHVVEQARRVVRVLHPQHLDREIWEASMSRLREQLYEEAQASCRAMEDAIKSDRCLADYLADYYALPGIGRPSRACGGCSACRKQGRTPYVQPVPWGRVPWRLSLESLADAEVPSWLTDGPKVLGVTYRRGDNKGRRKLIDVVFKLARRGFRQVVAPPDFFHELASDGRPIPLLFSEHEYDPPEWMNAPTLVLFELDTVIPSACLTGPPWPRILIFPEDAPDPRFSDRLLRHTLEYRSLDHLHLSLT